MSEGGRRFVLAATLPTSDICYQWLHVITAPKSHICRSDSFSAEGQRREAFSAWHALGAPPLFENVYSVIPFHALPFGLSLGQGERALPKPKFIDVWKNGNNMKGIF
jgi:hypothetical protein